MKYIKNWVSNPKTIEELNKSYVTLEKWRQRVDSDRLISTKVQLIANSDSKNIAFEPSGSSIFKLYNFDYWQYIDQYIYWDGLIPTADLIEAAHLNGVLIYGTVFFNWSNTFRDQLTLIEWLEEDEEGSKTYPYARKLVEIALYYGFDGYFINPETTGPLTKGMAEHMRDFLIYAKQYAKEQNAHLKFAWYDAMANDGLRHHYDEVNSDNDFFLAANQKGHFAADEFFINFNWNDQKNLTTLTHMKYLNRNPFDAYAGFELQQNSYNTRINYSALLDNHNYPQLSLGLFAADSILGLADDGDDYHTEEEKFWSAHTTLAKDELPDNWKAIGQLTSLKTVIHGDTFYTNFNTGHGKDWFINGIAQEIGQWNQRGMQSILPSWRWKIESTSDASKLNATYQFEHAYNSGSSIELSGKLARQSEVTWYLFACELDIKKTSRINLTFQLDGLVALDLVIGTHPTDMKQDISIPLSFDKANHSWQTSVIDLTDFTDQKIYYIKLKLHQSENATDFILRLGELSLNYEENKIEAVEEIKWLKHAFVDSLSAKGVIQFTHPQAEKVNYFEVYQKINDDWQIVNASRKMLINLPRIKRNLSDDGLKQSFAVVAVSKSGQRSNPSLTELTWPIETNDMTALTEESPNLMLEARVTSVSHEEQAERAQNALNGTISGVSDKWVSLAPDPNYIEIALPKAESIKQIILEHAGAGGESVDDGLMNTKAFTIDYRNNFEEAWQTAVKVTDNLQHISKHLLSKEVLAQYWRLAIQKSHNDSPWGGVRIYNWKMYDSLTESTQNIPLHDVKRLVNRTGEEYIVWTQAKSGSQIEIYQDLESKSARGVLEVGMEKFAVLRLSDMNKISNRSKDIYYQIKIDNLESNRIKLADTGIKMEDLSIELIQPTKKVFTATESIEFEDGGFQISFNDLSDAQLFIPLNHTLVNLNLIEINGEDNNAKLADKIQLLEVKIELFGETLSETIQIARVDTLSQSIETINVSIPPRLDYYEDEMFDAYKGKLEIILLNGFTYSISFNHPDLQLKDFTTKEIGAHELLLSYFEHTFKLKYQVYAQTKTVNYEKLEQRISEIQAYIQQKSNDDNPNKLVEELDLTVKKVEDKISNTNFTQAEIDAMWEKLTDLFKKTNISNEK